MIDNLASQPEHTPDRQDTPRYIAEEAITEIDAQSRLVEHLGVVAQETQAESNRFNQAKGLSESPLGVRLAKIPGKQLAHLQGLGEQMMEPVKAIRMSQEKFEEKIKKDRAKLRMVKDLDIEHELTADEVIGVADSTLELKAKFQSLDMEFSYERDIDFREFDTYHKQFHLLARDRLTSREAAVVTSLGFRHLARTLEKDHGIPPEESGTEATAVMMDTWLQFQPHDLVYDPATAYQASRYDTTQRLMRISPHLRGSLDIINDIYASFVAKEREFTASHFETLTRGMDSKITGIVDYIEENLHDSTDSEVQELKDRISTVIERFSTAATLIYGRRLPPEFSWLGKDQAGRGMLQATRTIETPQIDITAVKSQQADARQPFLSGRALREVPGGKEFSHLLTRGIPDAQGKPALHEGDITDAVAKGLPKLITNIIKKIDLSKVRDKDTVRDQVLENLYNTVIQEADLARKLQQAGDKSEESKPILGELIQFAVHNQEKLSTAPLSVPIRGILSHLIGKFSQ